MVKAGFFCSVSALALVLAGCSQPPAEVVYKGNQFFGREHEGVVNSADNETFDETAPRYKPGYARPVQDAAVTPVAVKELKAPSESASNSTIVATDQHVLTVPVPHTQASAPRKADVADASKFIWPVDGGKIIAHFGASAGNQNGKSNDGINISTSEGEPIFAVADGTVVYAGNELQGYGNMVIIRHANGWMTAYANARSLAVKKGMKVKQSDLIAYVGATGGVSAPQLHFAMRKDKTPVDPEQYLPHNG